MNLKCPNLLTIFDLKTSDAGDTFVVMEYVAGPSLASVLKQYPAGLPLPEVRHWLKGLVEGVAYLHDHGIVHRDLKPANLFMEEGIVKIGDYGLAKLITPSQGTEHSESIGTCHYMAPEIGSGKYHKPIDVYAMGVILYEMLTGRVPFEGETVNEVLMKHLTARPDVSMLPEPYQVDRGQGAGQRPEPSPQPALRPAAPRRCSRVARRPDHRRRQAGAGRDKAAAARGPTRTTSCGSRPRSRSSTSGPDTRPPRARNAGGIGERIRANWQAASTSGSLTKAAGRAESTTASRWSAAGSRRGSRRPVLLVSAEQPPPRPAPVPEPPPVPAAGSASPSWPHRCSGPPRSWRF